MGRMDVMVDIETLGTESDSTIFQISAIAFDITTGKHIDKFNMSADIEKNERLSVTGSTFKWWLKTNKELLTSLLDNEGDSSDVLLIKFRGWLNQLADAHELHLWGNGILFDNHMIKYQLEALGFDYPIRFTNDRDVRTIVDLAAIKLDISPSELKAKYNDESETAHNAIDDVAYQIRLVTGCYKNLIEGGSNDDYQH